MNLALILPALSAVAYSIAAILSKRALGAGFGTLRLALVINLLFVPVFALVLLRHEGVPRDAQWLHPVLAGVAFFCGQAFTFAAIRTGDVSVQTPVMGVKVVFVVVMAMLLGTETLSIELVLAAVISMCAVALLGLSGGGAHHIVRTIVLSLVSAFFFAVADTMVGMWGSAFGSPLFLFIAILTNALLSFGVVPFFREPIRAIPPKAWRWGVGAGLVMALQALALNYGLTTYQNVASANVIYSTRGLWSVLLAAIPLALFANSGQPITRSVRNARFIGALMMCGSIFILFSTEG